MNRQTMVARLRLLHDFFVRHDLTDPDDPLNDRVAGVALETSLVAGVARERPEVHISFDHLPRLVPLPWPCVRHAGTAWRVVVELDGVNLLALVADDELDRLGLVVDGDHIVAVSPAELVEGGVCEACSCFECICAARSAIDQHVCNRIAVVRGVPMACDLPPSHDGQHRPASGGAWMESEEDEPGVPGWTVAS